MSPKRAVIRNNYSLLDASPPNTGDFQAAEGTPGALHSTQESGRKGDPSLRLKSAYAQDDTVLVTFSVPVLRWRSRAGRPARPSLRPNHPLCCGGGHR